MYFTTDKILEVSGEMSEALFEEKKEPVLLNRMGFDQQNSPAMTKLRDNGIWDYSGNSTPSSNSISAF